MYAIPMMRIYKTIKLSYVFFYGNIIIYNNNSINSLFAVIASKKMNRCRAIGGTSLPRCTPKTVRLDAVERQANDALCAKGRPTNLNPRCLLLVVLKQYWRRV